MYQREYRLPLIKNWAIGKSWMDFDLIQGPENEKERLGNALWKDAA